MILTLDVETTFIKTDKGSDPSPYAEGNQLVSVGFKEDDKPVEYVWFYHADRPPTENNMQIVQDALDRTDVLLGHNIKFDLQWLFATGFTYSGAVYDTMVFDYVWARGVKVPLSLDECCRRHQTPTKKKKGILEKYLQDGMGFDIIPHEIVEEYGIADVQSTYEVALSQSKQEGKSIEQIAAYTVPVF
jgi:DNA polymerase I-like protein with 3'-5' exonuclease and polymerase domains|tara:strand:- start:229 stop:792 length:564 start_codon:yes stop_codon:yes gene_type:complete